MKNTEALEKRITELEYRIGVLENFLDVPSTLYHKDDESTISAIRMEVVRNMEKEGFEVEELRKIFGTKFYRKDSNK